MPFSVQCPACKSKFKATDDLAGTQQNCPVCQQPFQIPAHPSVTTEKSAAAPKNADSQTAQPARQASSAQSSPSPERPMIITDVSKAAPDASPSMPIIVTETKPNLSVSAPSVKPILTTASGPSPQAPSPQDSSAPQAENSRSSSNPFQASTAPPAVSQKHKHYPALEWVSLSYKISAGLAVIISVLVAAISFFSMEDALAAVIALITGASTAILLWAIAEGIRLAIDVATHLQAIRQNLESKE